MACVCICMSVYVRECVCTSMQQEREARGPRSHRSHPCRRRWSVRTTGCPAPSRASSSIFTSRAITHGWSHSAHAVTSLLVSWKGSLQCSTPGWMCHLLTFVCREKQAQVSTSLSLIQPSTSSAPCEHSHVHSYPHRSHSHTFSDLHRCCEPPPVR